MKKKYGVLFLLQSSIIAALAGFLFGFDTVVISGAEQKIQDLWNLTASVHGWAVSMALWGTVLGAMLGGLPAEKYGRKPTLLFIGALYLISAIGSALAPEVYSFMIFRFLGGIGVGISTVVAPMFISEIAPAKYRGRLAGMFQFNIVFGILIAYFSNSLINGIGEMAWRWMLGVEAFPAFIYTVLCVALPESPRWLILKMNDKQKAELVFRKIEPGASTERVNKLIQEVSETQTHYSNKDKFFSKKLILPVSIAFFVAFFNQLSGVNAILYFAPRIFELTGRGAQAAMLQSIGIGITNLIFTFVGLWLIDKIGRRTLLYIGGVGYVLSLGTCAWAFNVGQFGLVPFCIFGFIAAHAIGQGTVIWVLISEIFPNRFRAKGQTLGSFTHWFFAAIVTLIFPKMVEDLSPTVIFGLFCLVMVVQLIWIKLYVPETKGRSLEQIENDYKQGDLKNETGFLKLKQANN